MTAVAGRFSNGFHETTIDNSDAMKFIASTELHSPSHPSSLCVGCGSAIYDPFILHVQPDLEWHGRCLNCSKCHRSLGNDPTCFVRDGKAYCREDYLNTFFYRCAGCHQIVTKSDLVFRVRSRAFHLDCFRCSICERFIQPGEEIAFESDRICCLSHVQLRGGGQKIKAQSTETDVLGFDQTTKFEMDNSLKEKELRPGKQSLETSTATDCITLNSYTPAAPTAARRNQGLLPALLLNRPDHLKSMEPDDSTVYEDLCSVGDERNKRPRIDQLPKISDADFPDTFCPSSPPCRPNSSGSSLGVAIRDTDSPLTASSELSHEDESSLLGLTNSSHGPGDSGINALNGHGPMIPGGGTPLSHTYGSTPVGLCGGSRTGSGSSSSGTSVTGGCGDEVVHNVSVVRGGGMRNGKSGGSKRSKDQKTTRVRTVLNEKQLHTLRTCYAANPRPDALMKEQLVEMTSLSPRVIRVWFQNKRCKDKKRQILLKQMEQHQQSGGRSGPLHGISMIAGSPIRNDPNLLCSSSGIDVQQVLGPYWKSPPHNEHPPRSGGHGPLFKPNSPYSHAIQSKMSRSQSPCLSTMMSAHGLNGPSSESCYPPNLSALGNLMTSFASAVNASNSTSVANGPFPSVVQSPNVIDRSRFGLLAPQGGASVLPPGFPEDQPPIAAFQQLVSHFDTTDSPTVHLPGGSMLATSVCFGNNEFSKAPPQSISCDNPLFPSISSQLPPNLSIPLSSRMNSLDTLPSATGTPSAGFLSSNNISLFTASPSNVPPPPPPLSPHAITLNMLTSSPQQVPHYPLGSYHHGGGIGQTGLIASSSRTSLST